MLKLGRVTKVKVLFLVLVFVFNFELFKFSAAILEKGLLMSSSPSKTTGVEGRRKPKVQKGHYCNNFQDKLKRHVKKTNSSDKVLVFADKSRNVYELDKTQYEKLLRENITKSYRKTDERSADSVNQELNDIATKVDIGDRIESTARQEAFISLKDHKENFQNNRSFWH